ncbi:iron transporter [Helicobacter sp. L8]|uniref:iron transporter n=1 Tax=Helicobacter sp. L8 TaxID=2316078 RepID=UPI000EB5078D|nr:iron transporter [Helicobacter sp. L8]
MKNFFLGLVLVLMPIFTACMCFGVFAILHDYSCPNGVWQAMGAMGLALVYVLSFLPIREICKYTGWRFACGVSEGFNAVGVILFPAIMLFLR